MFAVVRHPDVAVPGVVAAAALDHMRANGWIRISEYRDQPDDFHLPEFADVTDDLDAEPEVPPIVVDVELPDDDAKPAKAVKATKTTRSKA